MCLFKVCIFQGNKFALSKDHLASPIKSTVSLNSFETRLHLSVWWASAHLYYALLNSPSSVTVKVDVRSHVNQLSKKNP